MQGAVIVVTKGESLLMDGVEAGLRAHGIQIYERHPCSKNPPDISVVEKPAVTVFDLDELSQREIAALRESTAHRPGTLLALNRNEAVAVRYRVDHVVLTKLTDVVEYAPTPADRSVATVSDEEDD